MEYPALKKFMKQMGITYYIVRTSGSWLSDDDWSRMRICMRIQVYYQGNVEYQKYHCYIVKKDGSVIYDGGGEIKGVKDGILAYLGDDVKVDNYFDNLARIKAREYFKKNI